MKSFVLALVCVALFGLLGCSHPSPHDAMVKLSARGAEARRVVLELSRKIPRHSAPGAVSGFDCVLLSVSGEGIDPTYAEDKLASPCTSTALGLGATSQLVSMSEFLRGDTEISVSVKRGANRTVRLFGVDTPAHDGKCSLQTVPELFSETTRPFMFSISSVTTDIAGDTTIDMSNMYVSSTSSTPRDLVDACRPRVEKTIDAAFGYAGLLFKQAFDEYFNLASTTLNDSLTQNPAGTSILPPIFIPFRDGRMAETRPIAAIYTRFDSNASLERHARADLIFDVGRIQLSLYEKWAFRVRMTAGLSVADSGNSVCATDTLTGEPDGFKAAVWSATQWRTSRLLLNSAVGTLDTYTSDDQLESPAAVRFVESGGSATESAYLHVSIRGLAKHDSTALCSALDIRSAQIILKP